MKGLSTFVARCIVLVWMSLFVFTADAYGTELQDYEKMESWQVNREYIEYEGGVIPQQVLNSKAWTTLSLEDPLPKESTLRQGTWFRLELPQVNWDAAALLLKDMEAQRITIFLNGQLVYDEYRNYVYQHINVLVPVKPSDRSSTLYVYTHASQGEGGAAKEILYGEHNSLINHYASLGLEDIMIGSSIIFISLIMLVSSFFLRKKQVQVWVAISLVFLCVGILVCTYSSFLYNYFSEYGALFLLFFDISICLLPPLSTYVFEKVLGAGYQASITKYRIFLSFYTAICFLAMILYHTLGESMYDTYYFITVTVLGYLILTEFVLLTVTAIIYAIRKDRDALILAITISLFATLVSIDLVSFYLGNSLGFKLWKWGIFSLLGGLIVILARKFAVAHDQVVMYAKELEMFNEVVISSEKMEIVSELAASVAHEVKNPLQVTKGFLHLLKERSQDKEKRYLSLALEELERATAIISDFLTFAKPELEHITLLDVEEEFKHIQGVLSPLANMQGGRIDMNIPSKLMIKGNSAKFKQAFINIIKNSLEAIDSDGIVRIWAYEENERVIIHIQDTGKGMTTAELVRLGGPHFSTKSKGTGLSLMVTNRIIEMMDGTIEFRSMKQIGTEVIVTLKAADSDEYLTSLSE